MKKGKRAIIILALILSMCITFPMGVSASGLGYGPGDKDQIKVVDNSNCVDRSKYKKMTVKKNGITKNGNSTSLGGATFGIYYSEDDAEKDKNRIETITGNQGGVASTAKLYKTDEDFYVKEISAPAGYAVNTQVFKLEKVSKDDRTWNGKGNRILVGNNINRDAILDSPLTSLKATKVWNDLDGFTGCHPTIELQLYQNGKPLGTPKALENGKIEITFNDLPKYDVSGATPVAYQYTVKETKEAPGYVKTETGMTVTNTAIAPVDVTITANKDLSKLEKVPAKNKVFDFILEDEEGNKIDKKTNAGENITFDPMTFAYDQVGEHIYKLYEKNLGETINGITHDSEVYTVKITISQRDNGQLATPTVQYFDSTGAPVENVVFHNSYSAKPATIKFKATKVLENAPPLASGFKFEAKDEDGQVVSTGQVENNGKINFTEFEINEPGEYEYTIAEVNGGQFINNIQHDDMKMVVKVSVSDNHSGQLETIINYPEDTEFNNIYIDPINYTVVKKWDKDTEKERPESISIQLYQNGQPCGVPVEVTAEDEWTYTWTDLDGRFEYTADEVKVPENYIKKLEATEEGVIITNTYNKKDVPVTPDKPTPKTSKETPKAVAKTGVKTGDSAEIGLYLFVMVAAGSAVCGFNYKRRHKNSKG